MYGVLAHFGHNKDFSSNFGAESSNHAAIEAIPESLTIRRLRITRVCPDFVF